MAKRLQKDVVFLAGRLLIGVLRGLQLYLGSVSELRKGGGLAWQVLFFDKAITACLVGEHFLATNLSDHEVHVDAQPVSFLCEERI
jgi:hypothetical protein